MKKLLIGCAAAVVLVVASFGVVGLRVEPVLRQMLDTAAADNPNMAFTLKSKAMGLFSSRYVYAMTYTLPRPQQPGAPMTIQADITYTVAHGPLPGGSFPPCLAVVDVGCAIDPATSQELRAFLDTFPELAASTVRTRLAFDSSTVTDVNVPAFSKTLKGNPSLPVDVAFKGLTASVNMSTGAATCTGWVSAPGLSVQDAASTFVLDGLRWTMDSTRLAPRLWAGTQRMQVQTISLRAEGKDPIAVQGCAMDVAVTPRAEVLDYGFVLSGAVARQMEGPLPFSLSFSLRNLDIRACGELMALLQRHGIADPDPAGFERELLSLGQAALARSPSLDVDVTALEGARQIRLHCGLRLEPTDAPPSDFVQAIPLLRASADVTGGVRDLIDLLCAMARETETANLSNLQCPQNLALQIELAAAMGMVRLDNDRLFTKADWDGRSLTVNGRPLR